ncbi:5,6-dimethylbenzimidazole synthase [Pseudomonas sp. F1_0610]|uniref:5,6-dimethylbenzimidazole synthase n=1 Tax=Pseudomonas sp. F1_0610 TaxID=3114284 RepID=UPI0039C166D0
MSNHVFSAQERAVIYKVIEQRRDMRHFAGGIVESEVLARVLQAAHHAPSVGLMQPWRFIRITDLSLRKAIKNLVEQERLQTAQALGERDDEFMRLKVEGITECAELIVVALTDKRESYIFGRRTLPEMDLASVACAIQNMWLAARAENLGMGWVSLFDPQQLAQLLAMPLGSKPVAILCLGAVDKFYSKPMLVEEGWASEKVLSELLYNNQWQQQ